MSFTSNIEPYEAETLISASLQSAYNHGSPAGGSARSSALLYEAEKGFILRMLWPSLAFCQANEDDLYCGLPDALEPDGDVAGRGVLIAFVVAVATSFVAAGFVLFAEWHEYFGKPNQHRRMHHFRMFADTYLVSLSDTQAVTSLALLITTNFFLGCTITAYHYDLVCSLVLMSSAAHIGSLAVMHRYFDAKKHQSWQHFRSLTRVAMILASFILSYVLFRCRSEIFPSFRPLSNTNDANTTTSTGLVLPAVCFIDHPGYSNASSRQNFTASPSWSLNLTTPVSSNHSSLYGNSSSYGTSNISTPVTMPAFATFSSNDDLTSTGDMVALCFLFGAFILTALTSFILFLVKMDRTWHNWVAYSVRLICFVTTYVIAWYGFARFQQLQHWMKYSGWFGEDDGEESMASFGQLMPLVLLFLPVLALIEAFAERRPPPRTNDDDGGSTNSQHRLRSRDGKWVP
ncbi:hypothetical protein K458DRAFT_488961 [Lentithecium fluviatile CBS 122367]|uniref:Uncharacterized protein n=1 Tax=Lentithecium fluviatile CBS 122367 TaxID=1168545 RepID=A0A6G1IUJ6_9PLEO|nr:hypothetical protein K458DRAFT_488961 [Lentithecium fluviatile CBS 122367]